MRKTLAVIGLIFCSTSVFGAYASFVKFKDIKSRSTDPAHPGWFAVSSFSWGASGGNMHGDVHDVTLTIRNAPELSQLGTMALAGHSQTVLVDVGPEHYTFDNALIGDVRFNSLTNDVSLKLNFVHYTMTVPPKTPPAPPQNVAATIVNPSVNPFAPNAQLFINDTPGERLRLVGLRFTGEHTAILTVREGTSGGFFAPQRSASKKNRVTVQKDYVKYTLTDCVISSYSKAGDETATVGLNFAQYYGPVGGLQQ